MSTTSNALEEFYGLLDQLRGKTGERCLKDCNGRMAWPNRGVYFFFEHGERRGASGKGLRVVRIGTHSIGKKDSQRTLWDRLKDHQGKNDGGGRHRTSVFRRLIGESLKGMHPDRWDTDDFNLWGIKRKALGRRGLKQSQAEAREVPLEKAVSEYIGRMPFLWVEVPDEPGPCSDRAFIERNAIGLLSTPDCIGTDPASPTWLGRHSCRRGVIESGQRLESGLWLSDHVGGGFDPDFLEKLGQYIDSTHPLDR